MVTSESEILATLCGQIPSTTELYIRVDEALKKLIQLDARSAREAERLARENFLFGHPDKSKINGRPHHLDIPEHGGVEANLGYRRP